ncbi:hypothetical protein [Xylanibacter muris]|uniref:hypothetical protein n=1 Tax=Xylanibacter muris TaxID=2736290 RepID=UPI0025A2BBDE|nr:hypothetical protein [Xylanibacter muris]
MATWNKGYYIQAVLARSEAKNRASGRTTRQVDNYIQELFNAKIGEWITLFDHSECRTGNDGLFHKIRKRMEFEHGINLEVKRESSTFAVRIPESIMVDMANFRTIMIEDAERGLNAIEK